jgi:uncharacterized protein involved in type VI secretion and phage assembly
MFDRVAAWFRGGSSQSGYVTTATVVDNVDASGTGRVAIESGAEGRQWARTATLMAGPDRGTWFVPDIGDEVVVVFDRGDRRDPIVVGSLWSDLARPPEAIGAANERRAIVTRSGARLVIDDASAGCVMRLTTPQGQHVTLDDRTPNAVTIADNSGNTIGLSSSGVAVTCSSTVTVTANRVRVTAASVEVNSGMVDVSGVLKCSTMIADSVVANSYTPGAGNVS